MTGRDVENNQMKGQSLDSHPSVVDRLKSVAEKSSIFRHQLGIGGVLVEPTGCSIVPDPNANECSCWTQWYSFFYSIRIRQLNLWSVWYSFGRIYGTLCFSKSFLLSLPTPPRIIILHKRTQHLISNHLKYCCDDCDMPWMWMIFSRV